jgi:hypothetical protein
LVLPRPRSPHNPIPSTQPPCKTCHACHARPRDGAAVDPCKTPAVGDTARDFELTGLGGDKVKLSTFTADGTVVLVVLRGWPGYQCPICTRQSAGFMAKADDVLKVLDAKD